MHTSSDVVATLKHLLLVRLELEETGVTADEIREDTLLLDGAGLGLDSVEVLDLLVGIEKSFGLRIRNIDKDFIEANCHSIRSLTDYILVSCAALAGDKEKAAES